MATGFWMAFLVVPALLAGFGAGWWARGRRRRSVI